LRWDLRVHPNARRAAQQPQNKVSKASHVPRRFSSGSK
jgi:hypothetical protein